MKTVVLSLIVLLNVMPLAAAKQSHRISETEQPAADRQVEGDVGSTLFQPPNQISLVVSDESCDACGSGAQAIADNFTVDTGGMGFDLQQILLWGVFFPGNVPPALDDFVVRVHIYDTGLPGTVVCSWADLTPVSRVDTGVNIGTWDEYQITLDLPGNCPLADIPYWIEIYNNTGPGTDDWAWESGVLDPINGTAGGAYAAEAPGVSWIPDAIDFAVQLNGTLLPVELQSFSIE